MEYFTNLEDALECIANHIDVNIDYHITCSEVRLDNKDIKIYRVLRV